MTDGSLAQNLDRVRAAVSAAAARAGRDPQTIRLIAVTKTVPVDRIREAIALGLRTFGENRVQEAVPKIEALATERGEWHLIGHLQRNKVKDVAGHFAMVQSVDSVRLVEALGPRAGTPLDVLIEVISARSRRKREPCRQTFHRLPMRSATTRRCACAA